MSLRLVPIDLSEANDYVERHHRHSKPVVGQKFSVSAYRDSGIVGVAIAGRPVARELDDGYTLEISRLCTDGAKNTCTFLYGACCRAGAALGYTSAITYTLESERGTSLRAAGFLPAGEVKDRQWGTAARPREQRELLGDKIRWERKL